MSDSADRFDFLKQPFPKKRDGIDCVVIHEKAHTELGRLLCMASNAPVAIPGHPKEWESLEAVIRALGTPPLAAWVRDYYTLYNTTKLGQADRRRVEEWMTHKLIQNWHAHSALLNERLPFACVYRETIMIEGIEHYVPIPTYRPIINAIVSYRNKLRDKQKRQADRDEKRERKQEYRQGLTPRS